MSYYKQIAEMFGLKLNEEFILADTDGSLEIGSRQEKKQKQKAKKSVK